MTMPSLIFAFFIASLLGALYHLVRGGGVGRLFLYLIFSWAGFALGHLLSIWQEWLIFPFGQLDLGLSILGSLVLLLGGDWISRLGMSSPQHYSDDENGV